METLYSLSGPIATCLQIVARLQDRADAVTEYVEFKDCGHIPMDEYPQEFVSALRPFVEKVLMQPSNGSSSNNGNGFDEAAVRRTDLLAGASSVRDAQVADSVAASR